MRVIGEEIERERERERGERGEREREREIISAAQLSDPAVVTGVRKKIFVRI